MKENFVSESELHISGEVATKRAKPKLQLRKDYAGDQDREWNRDVSYRPSYQNWAIKFFKQITNSSTLILSSSLNDP